MVAAHMTRLPPSPEIDWSDDDAPRARTFDDVYYSRDGGSAEADAVFLRGCGLPESWRERGAFSICELGFGAGLNFLSAWRVWRTTRMPHAILHISSIEAYPLAREHAARALARFGEVQDLAATLLKCWPVRAFSAQRFWFAQDRVSLTLQIGDAAQILMQSAGKFDAWFLDGFSPARNPEMWSETVFAQMARLSAPDARVASFSVAGSVRRGLQAQGFAVERKPGFAGKRERLEARFVKHRTEPSTETARAPYPYAAAHPKRVAIIGAGIAGAACAAALTRRGVETIVLDAAPSLGAGASFNPAALIMPRLDRGGVLRRFYVSAYLHAVAAYEQLGVFSARVVEERADPRRVLAFADLRADPPLPSDWFEAVADGAALHPRGGVIRAPEAVTRMLDGAALLLEAPIEALEFAAGWVLRAPDGRARLKADAVMLACGADLARFAPARFLPLELTLGQIEWGEGAPPERAMTRGSYVAPWEGGLLFGATFDRAFAGAHASEDARARNLMALAALAPEIAAGVKPESLRSRAAMRVSTPDRAPVAGLLPDADAWLRQYADLAHGRAPKTLAPPPAHHGLYVLGGLGARGFTLAPILAERIAAEMFGEPHMLLQPELDALHPARFLHRTLLRGSA
jgi:tRNA 5-methylaminomethyl-2-thiouridine biosynthesis bifunctional protein